MFSGRSTTVTGTGPPAHDLAASAVASVEPSETTTTSPVKPQAAIRSPSSQTLRAMVDSSFRAAITTDTEGSGSPSTALCTGHGRSRDATARSAGYTT